MLALNMNIMTSNGGSILSLPVGKDFSLLVLFLFLLLHLKLPFLVFSILINTLHKAV